MQYRNSTRQKEQNTRRPQNDNRMLESMDLSAIDNFNEIEVIYGDDVDV